MDAAISKFRITGLCAAPFTPFSSAGNIDVPALSPYIEELVAQGVKYAFVNGTTGEGYLCSVAERKALTEGWVQASQGRVAIIANCGAEAEVDMVDLAAHAAASGCTAIAITVRSPRRHLPAAFLALRVRFLIVHLAHTPLP